MDNQYKIIPINEFSSVHDQVRYSTYIWQDKVDNSLRYHEVYDEFNQQHLNYALSDLEYINLLPSPDNLLIPAILTTSFQFKLTM